MSAPVTGFYISQSYKIWTKAGGISQFKTNSDRKTGNKLVLMN